jgi:hypothetical protein
MKKSSFAVETLDERRAVSGALYDRARKYGLSRRMNEETADDFASFTAIAYLETGRYDLHWHLVDFMRETVGRHGTKCFEVKSAIALPLHLEHEDLDLRDRLAAPERDLSAQRELQSLMLFIPDERTREIFRLYLEGHNLREIAERVQPRARGRRSTAQRKVWVRNRKGKLVRRLPKDEAPADETDAPAGGITESRVSQIMTNAILHIRRKLGLPSRTADDIKFGMPKATEMRECAGGCGESFFAVPESDRWFIKGHEGGACAERPLASEMTKPKEPVVVEEDAAAREVHRSKATKRERKRVELKEMPALEDGVPIPENSAKKKSALRELSDSMKPGQSLRGDKRTVLAVAGHLKKRGMRSIIRMLGNEEYRVWCTEPPAPAEPEDDETKHEWCERLPAE